MTHLKLVLRFRCELRFCEGFGIGIIVPTKKSTSSVGVRRTDLLGHPFLQRCRSGASAPAPPTLFRTENEITLKKGHAATPIQSTVYQEAGRLDHG